LLRDPFGDNVIPLVEELQRRLSLANAICHGQAEEEEQPGAENSEENGKT
jgi:hypothetical protein